MKPLTETEIKILRMLAREMSYRQICDRMGIPTGTLHSHCYQIRKKTGIKRTQDHQECQLFLSGWHRPSHVPDRKKSLTPRQLEVLRGIANGMSYKQLGKNPQTVQTIAYQACQRVGIVKLAFRRTAAIQDYLRLNGYWSPPVTKTTDPMFD